MKNLLVALLLFPLLVQAKENSVVCKEPKSALFKSDEVMEITVKGPFPLRREYWREQHRMYDGSIEGIAVQLSLRGKSRLESCEFPPLRITWPEDKSVLDDTPFDKLKGKSLKLITHCRYATGTAAENEWVSQRIIREYMSYKILEALELPSYKARLVRANYQDRGGIDLVQGYGVFLEPPAAFGARCGLKQGAEMAADVRRIVRATPAVRYASMLLARIVLGARDYIVDWDDSSKGHNTDIFVDEAGVPQLVIPYDFNDSAMAGSNGGWSSFEFDLLPTLVKCPFNRNGHCFKNIEMDGWHAEVRLQVEKVLGNKERALSLVTNSKLLNAESKDEMLTKLNMVFDDLTGLLEWM
jgi:hypothetical protein